MSAQGSEVPRGTTTTTTTVPQQQQQQQQPSIAIQQPSQQTVQQMTQTAVQQHPQAPHVVVAPHPQVDTAALLMANPHMAAVVATVAAAAAQQMAQAQQQQQHTSALAVVPQHTMQVAASPHHTIQPAPAVVQHAPAVSTAQPAPAPSPAIAATAPQSAIPPHLAAAMFGVVPQYTHAAPLPPATAPPTATVAVAPPPTSPSVTTVPSNTLAAASIAVQQSQTSGVVTNAMIANMQTWKLDQLEAHAKLLQDSGQPVPQAVAMLLADARRKEEKRTAKRVANRKSACTSRARKKALVEEMTRTNARLKRQALILALLPDLVIAITVDGEITFCSAQVERVLKHKIDNLIGANLAQLLLPESRQALSSLIQELVAAEKAAKDAVSSCQVKTASPSDQVNQAEAAAPANAGGESKEENENGNNSYSGVSSNSAAVVSEQSFPMQVVNVESQQANVGGDKKVADGSKKRSENSASKRLECKEGAGNGVAAPKNKTEKQPSSDESLSSSSDTKNLSKANENLNRNVRWHNEKLQSESKLDNQGPKDDVTGASVTENNRHARLSSLKHVPDQKNDAEDHSSSSSDSLLAGVEESKKLKKEKKTPRRKNGNSSDDSGYRESNESAREDTSSSSSDNGSSTSNIPGIRRRLKPLAPTCNICLIRNDLTTIWCEVTSSISTRSVLEEPVDGTAAPSTKKAADSSENKKRLVESIPSGKAEVKDLLLCLRPIQDGADKVAESLRFGPRKATTTEATLRPHENRSSLNGVGSDAPEKRVPMKKRAIVHQDAPTARVSNSSCSNEDVTEHAQKKAKKSTGETEKSVVESLMCLSNNAK